MSRSMQPPTEPDSYAVRPSRTEQKREHEALRELVINLVELSPGRFAKVELPEELKLALAEARRLKDPNAKRRQILFASGLLDAEEAATIRARIQAIDLGR